MRTRAGRGQSLAGERLPHRRGTRCSPLCLPAVPLRPLCSPRTPASPGSAAWCRGTAGCAWSCCLLAPRSCPSISGRNCRAAGVVRCPSCPGSVTALRTVLLHGRREQEAPKGSARREHPRDERAAASLCQNIGAAEPERTAGRKAKRCPAAPVGWGHNPALRSPQPPLIPTGLWAPSRNPRG